MNTEVTIKTVKMYFCFELLSSDSKNNCIKNDKSVSMADNIYKYIISMITITQRKGVTVNYIVLR